MNNSTIDNNIAQVQHSIKREVSEENRPVGRDGRFRVWKSRQAIALNSSGKLNAAAKGLVKVSLPTQIVKAASGYFNCANPSTAKGTAYNNTITM